MRLPLVTAIALVLSGTALTSGVYAAEFAVPTAATSAASAITTQLPRTARPSHYAIEITPHAETMTFDGSVRIDVEVLAPTDAIVLQAAQLTFGKATLARQAASRSQPRSAPTRMRRPPALPPASHWRRASTC